MNTLADDYPCLGVCMPDPESGYCLGCGRPPLPAPSELAPKLTERREAVLEMNPRDCAIATKNKV